MDLAAAAEPALSLENFADDNPHGFGLLQRDRDFADYQDDGAFYHKRPSLWVEPLGQWGKGAVQLVELPIADEIRWTTSWRSESGGNRRSQVGS